ncbi:hypothetical protein GCM10023185_22360 [Hymenobacter saemangeumensis]|uniref:Uncharacterized protein n=1 Tax=Hymenobacter saemangeumensis TaxID=1084522 RepID=A0ABP8IF14_9BACT
MTEEQEKIRADLPRLVGYFKGIAAGSGWHPLWKTEYEVASATVHLLLAKDDFTEADFAEIASCVNTLVGKEHADGCGWLDFQLQLSHFFRVSGYQSDWNGTTGKFTFGNAASGC